MGADNLVNYNIQKGKLFKTTIAISAIYGFVAVVLLGLTLTTGDSSDSVVNSFKPFVMTLMGGMVFTLLVLVIQIATFAPPSVSIAPDSGYVCPDFWTLQKTPTTDPDYTAAGTDAQALMTYQCVPNNSVYNLGVTASLSNVAAAGLNNLNQKVYSDGYVSGSSNNIYGVSIAPNANKADPINTLINAASKMYHGTYANSGTAGGTITGSIAGNSNIRCDKLFPGYLSQQDKQNYPSSPNLLRCQYAQQCHIPWTGVCPNRP